MMKLLGLIYMMAGGSLSILALRVGHGVWADVWEIAMYSAIPNALTALFAFLFFSKTTPDATMHRVFLIACYLIGIGVGAYFYFT